MQSTSGYFNFGHRLMLGEEDVEKMQKFIPDEVGGKVMC